jgi:glutamate racemase
LNTRKTREILEKALQPMLAQGIDTVVLGCTHYPFIIPLIREIAGPAVRVIDPAPAVARQTERLLEAAGMLAGSEPGRLAVFTSGDAEKLKEKLVLFLGEDAKVDAVEWIDETGLIPGEPHSQRLHIAD